MKLSTYSAVASALMPLISATASQFGVLEFQNFGYSGSYKPVASISDEDTDQCTCQLSDNTVAFSGPNAPISEEVSVHFRGPLVLSQFAYYTSDDSAKSNWTRQAFYEGSSSTANNVTFLTTAGKNSSCLGKALTFADKDGVSEAQQATVLAENTKIISGQEYSIFSNISCGSSGVDKDCGVYRKGIPAFHGFYGAVKMFLFEFEMPQEDSVSKDDVFAWNMPAIWLLNAQIPRTSQFPTNGNCSCWSSGCGEFDIFEVMNTTESGHLYATIHDFQGTGDINNGLQDDGYIQRDFKNTMKGGVAFYSDSSVHVFLANSTSIDASIEPSTVESWIKEAGSSAVDTLSSVAPQSTSSKSKKGSGNSNIDNASIWSNIVLSAFTALYYIVA